MTIAYLKRMVEKFKGGILQRNFPPEDRGIISLALDLFIALIADEEVKNEK